MSPLLLSLLACGKSTAPPQSSENSPTQQHTGWPSSEEDSGTDLDGDGWTVAEGDCDDDDIYAHPGWEEQEEDGIDNDCDGYTDEVFSGLVAVQVWDGTQPAIIHHIDTLGNLSKTVTLDDPAIAPYFMVPGVSGGYMIGDLASASLFEVDSEGNTSFLASFEKEDGMWGMMTHPDGYYLVTTGTAVLAVEPGTGSITRMAEWNPEQPGTAILGFDLQYDPARDLVGLFGYYGGFATLEGSELTLLLPMGSDRVIYSGTHRHGGGWRAGGFSAKGFQVWELDEDSASWVDLFTFESQWSPTFIATDGDSGDSYLAANAASYPTVWRVSESSGAQDLFWESEATGSTNSTNMWDLFVLYE